MNTKVILTSPLKMIIPPTLAVCLFVGTIFAVILPSFDAGIMERKKETTVQLIDVAIGILSHFEDQAARGIISQQEAKALAVSEIRTLRYGKDNKDYFWINDLEPAIIMHPYRPELEGKKAVNLVDENERDVFQKIAAIAINTGTGFINYKWQWHDDRNTIVPKLSYVKVFPPWQWVIGTGLYLDDAKIEISALTAKLSGFALLALLLTTMISSYIARQSIVTDRRRRKAETALQHHHDQLEQTIQQRTTQLTLINEELVSEAGERRKAEKKITVQNAFLCDVIESLPFPFYVISLEDYSISLANQHATNEGGINSSHRCSALAHSKDNKLLCCPEGGHNCPVILVKSSKKPIMVEHTHYDHYGKEQYVEVHGYPVFDTNGDVTQVIKTVIDITTRKNYADKLAKISITDELTGLLNRRGFFVLAQKQLEIAKRKKCDLFLMYADLDNLKMINDTVGHNAGDAVIIETAKMFQTVFRKADIISRVGGDEFTILFTCEDHSGQEAIRRIDERLKEQIFLVNSSFDSPFELSISTGVAMFDADNPVTLEELMKSADSLMYSAKKNKKRNRN
jgi:diguanylate cyclase (GGDEF)-like protein